MHGEAIQIASHNGKSLALKVSPRRLMKQGCGICDFVAVPQDEPNPLAARVNETRRALKFVSLASSPLCVRNIV